MMNKFDHTLVDFVHGCGLQVSDLEFHTAQIRPLCGRICEIFSISRRSVQKSQNSRFFISFDRPSAEIVKVFKFPTEIFVIF